MNTLCKKILSAVLFIAANRCSIKAAEHDTPDYQKSQNFYTIWLPGLHGGRADENSLLTTTDYKIYDVIKPASQADLGQDVCIQDFERQLYNDEKFQPSKKVIFIGSSQGAATLLNKIARMTHEEQEAKIAALILEAPLADGNEAIMQSALRKPGLGYFPLVRFWSPWIGKVSHPHYNPYGMQAVASVKNISARIPVIVLHNKKDRRVSINSARRLVCEFFKTRQNHDNTTVDKAAFNNVYYIETDIDARYGDSHTDFLREDAQSSAAFHAICKKIGLAYDAKQAQEFDDEELCAFQPSVEQLEYEILKDSWRSSYVRNTIDGLTLVTVAAALYLLMKKLYSDNAKSA